MNQSFSSCSSALNLIKQIKDSLVVWVRVRDGGFVVSRQMRRAAVSKCKDRNRKSGKFKFGVVRFSDDKRDLQSLVPGSNKVTV